MLYVTFITQNELLMPMCVRGCEYVMLCWGIQVAPMGVCVCMETPIRMRQWDALWQEKLRLIKHYPLAYLLIQIPSLTNMVKIYKDEIISL